ncbi:hypothetical protein SAMN05216267_1006152 [Actinacidiphila rubida]|uniref:Uncharacterized protein n=1 Tax=Actinacidiphila rubida TaxID=310780 RepID=A0A1H8HB99_9ACTN|nr:hypothetical protein [Actinacidiphila rubida]SEN53380.1 hypothetical protein SAMN05216267_1006152 [Actinacidiphila rubida]
MNAHDAKTATATRPVPDLTLPPAVISLPAPISTGSPTPHSARAFRRITLLLRVHLAACVLTLGAAAALSGDSSAVNSAVWIRGTIVAAGALVMYLCAVRAARGSRGAYRRLRVLSAVTVAAVVGVVSLPGTFPLWMKAEQSACGLVLVAVVALANSRAVRDRFSCPAAVTEPAPVRS